MTDTARVFIRATKLALRDGPAAMVVGDDLRG